MRLSSEFLCDAVDRFISGFFSSHTCFSGVLSLYLSMILTVAFFGMTNVNNRLFGNCVWIIEASTQTVINAADFTVLICLCSCTPFQLKRPTDTLFLIIF